jgi:hypothetical protein
MTRIEQRTVWFICSLKRCQPKIPSTRCRGRVMKNADFPFDLGLRARSGQDDFTVCAYTSGAGTLSMIFAGPGSSGLNKTACGDRAKLLLGKPYAATSRDKKKAREKSRACIVSLEVKRPNNPCHPYHPYHRQACQGPHFPSRSPRVHFATSSGAKPTQRVSTPLRQANCVGSRVGDEIFLLSPDAVQLRLVRSLWRSVRVPLARF